MESTPSSSPQLNTPIVAQIVKQTPEQEEELKLRSKYPNAQKPGASAFIQKMLHKGNKKYFDSGDYNMAKSRCKANGNSNKLVQTTNINPNQCGGDSSSSNSSLNDSPSITNTVQNDSLTIQQQLQQQSTPKPSIELNVNNTSQVNSPLLTNGLQQQHQQYPTSPCVNYLNINSYSNHHHHSLSSSISASSLMTQSLNSEEIGHGIPTPECIQSRKHSIAQSKLATPRLSSS
ncbi:unnamed protein product [Brachionus calyciflorus]|uniref:Uncharacterized protein n=1 Tax=Brachionus calyciflorus TaxID=104777 RepID=A0A813UEY0_9BILA|nr:unnamed protein product [Brachionus calyciflorus]